MANSQPDRGRFAIGPNPNRIFSGSAFQILMRFGSIRQSICLAPVLRSLDSLLQVGLGYLRLGQPATELSGGEAQRIKLATELQKVHRGNTIYVLDEPTTGLHPADVSMLMSQLNGLVDAGNTVIAVEHDMQVAAASDWMIDIGPGAGNEGGQIVVQGTPTKVAKSKSSRTAPFLARHVNKVQT